MSTRDECETRIKARIAKIKQGPRSVFLSDIEWVMNHLRDDLGHTVVRSGTNNHYMYVIDDLEPFPVCDHHKGQSQLKIGYVNTFLKRMIDLEYVD